MRSSSERAHDELLQSFHLIAKKARWESGLRYGSRI